MKSMKKLLKKLATIMLLSAAGVFVAVASLYGTPSQRELFEVLLVWLVFSVLIFLCIINS